VVYDTFTFPFRLGAHREEKLRKKLLAVRPVTHFFDVAEFRKYVIRFYGPRNKNKTRKEKKRRIRRSIELKKSNTYDDIR